MGSRNKSFTVIGDYPWGKVSIEGEKDKVTLNVDLSDVGESEGLPPIHYFATINHPVYKETFDNLPDREIQLNKLKRIRQHGVKVKNFNFFKKEAIKAAEKKGEVCQLLSYEGSRLFTTKEHLSTESEVLFMIRNLRQSGMMADVYKEHKERKKSAHSDKLTHQEALDVLSFPIIEYSKQEKQSKFVHNMVLGGDSFSSKAKIGKHQTVINMTDELRKITINGQTVWGSIHSHMGSSTFSLIDMESLMIDESNFAVSILYSVGRDEIDIAFINPLSKNVFVSTESIVIFDIIDRYLSKYKGKSIVKMKRKEKVYSIDDIEDVYNEIFREHMKHCGISTYTFSAKSDIADGIHQTINHAFSSKS